jgi:hypothetical protein
MPAYFIFNNLKVNTFFLTDEPFPGFELLTWDHETFVDGTLWDIGDDAGYTPIGITKVYGQVWIPQDINKVSELEYFLGVHSGLTEPMKTKCHIVDNNIHESIDAIIYRLRAIDRNYTIVHDGKWMIKRR